MKKAVLYARVSTDIQQKEGTIESQVTALKQQIVENGDVLVKEYVDAGLSGAKIDRPALDQLRNDLKTDSFDAIYFLNTDRIARDVAYQHIIVTEILKHKKQIIINGKDYIHNPENKFELTILGAVAELERAKMLERSMRGKQHKLRQGTLLSYGYNIYGYDYIPRSDDSPARLAINENEASVVRFVFNAYVKKQMSWSSIIRYLENEGITTKMGNRHWPRHALRQMLQNHTYSGIRYFNTCKHVKTESSPLRKIKYGKKVFRDKSEWIGVKVPAIISQELFDKAQLQIKENKDRYLKPYQTQLLSNLIRCGECGRHFISYQRYMRRYYRYKGVTKEITHKVYFKAAYKCGRQWSGRVHTKTIDIKRCTNPEVSAPKIEHFIFKLIEEKVLVAQELKKHLETTSKDVKRIHQKIKTGVREINKKSEQLKCERKILLNEYAIGNVERDVYVEKCLWYDNEDNKLDFEKEELLKQISTFHKEDIIEANLRIFCETARAQYMKCKDFETKRKFILDFVDRIIYDHGKIFLIGSIPIRLKEFENAPQSLEANKITFNIEMSTV